MTQSNDTPRSAPDPLVALRADVQPLRAAASPSREGAGLDERMLRWVAAQPIGYGDWACRDCRPDSDMLVGGFRCMVHEARARLASEEQREDSSPGVGYATPIPVWVIEDHATRSIEEGRS